MKSLWAYSYHTRQRQAGEAAKCGRSQRSSPLRGDSHLAFNWVAWSKSSTRDYSQYSHRPSSTRCHAYVQSFLIAHERSIGTLWDSQHCWRSYRQLLSTCRLLAGSFVIEQTYGCRIPSLQESVRFYLAFAVEDARFSWNSLGTANAVLSWCF